MAACLALAWSQPSKPTPYRVYGRDHFERAEFGAYLVASQNFVDNRLVAALRGLLQVRKPSTRILSVVIVQRDRVLICCNSSGPYTYDNPAKMNGTWNETSELAGLFYLDGNARAYIKHGSTLQEVQLLGSEDPTRVQVGQRSMRLVPLWLQDSFNNRLALSAVAQELPTEAEADQIYARFRFGGGEKDPMLNIRTEAAFGMPSGPYLDVTRFPFPDLPKDAFYSTAYVECLPFSNLQAGLREGCHIAMPVEHHPYTFLDWLRDRK